MQTKFTAEFLNKLKLNKELDKNKVILIAIACLILVCLDFFFIIKAQNRGAALLTPKITKLKEDIKALSDDLSAIKELKQKGQAQSRDSSLTKKVIREEEIPLLLQDITDIANKNNVKIIQIKPGKDPKAKEEIVAGSRILPVMIKLDLYCSYHPLGSFINALENADKFMLIQEIKILTSPNDYLCQDAVVIIKAYVKK